MIELVFGCLPLVGGMICNEIGSDVLTVGASASQTGHQRLEHHDPRWCHFHNLLM